MVLGIGMDIIEIARIEKALGRAHFRERVFTKNEMTYAEGKKKSKFSSYAARWAAKEAVMKALGKGMHFGEFRGIEVCRNEGKAPKILLYGSWQKLAHEKGVENIYLTLTHSRCYAAATCILEGGKA